MTLTLINIFVFLFGLIMGSFLNVVIYRYNTGKGIGGRSECMACGKTLRWYELVPVVSYLAQGGRCRGCGTGLSVQYPAVETATGLLFITTFLMRQGSYTTPRGLVELSLMLAAWCLLVVIFVYDLKHRIIPDGLVYAFAVLGLVRIAVEVPLHPFYPFLMSLLAGPLLFLPFYLLWLVSGGKWIGFGDGKLALGIGWMLGLGLGISAIFLSFWIGAAVSVGLILMGKLNGKGNLGMKSEIPFAPYLVIGFAVAYFFSIDVIGVHRLFGL